MIDTNQAVPVVYRPLIYVASFIQFLALVSLHLPLPPAPRILQFIHYSDILMTGLYTCLAACGVAMLAAVAGAAMRKWRSKLFKGSLYLLIYPASGLAGVLVSMMILCQMSQNRGLNTGSKIVQKLESHKVTSGKYPDNLEQIFQKVPQPWIFGFQGYEYNRIGDNDFQLGFYVNMNSFNAYYLEHRSSGDYPERWSSRPRMKNGWAVYFVD